jgi:hypothetical protein
VAIPENGEQFRRLAMPQNDERVHVKLLVGRAPVYKEGYRSNDGRTTRST